MPCNKCHTKPCHCRQKQCQTSCPTPYFYPVLVPGIPGPTGPPGSTTIIIAGGTLGVTGFTGYT